MRALKKALLLSYICIASVSAAIITPALPQIEATFSLGHGALEWVISIFLIGYVFGQLIYGPLANRFGRLGALRTGLIINLLGIVICLVSVPMLNYSVLLLGRLITALGAAAGLSCTFILINELVPKEEAGRVMSFAIVSFTVGVGFAVTLGGLVAQYSHWKNCFWLLFVHGVVMLVLTRQFPETLKNPVPLHPMKIISNYVMALKSNTLIIFSLVAGFVSSVSYVYSAAAPIYAQSVLHLTPEMYGFWNLINTIGMLGGGFASARLMKLCSAWQVLLIGFGFVMPGLISLIFIAMANQSYFLTIWFFGTTTWLYLFSGLLFAPASFFASNAIEDKASASSIMSFINMATSTVAVIVLGYLPFSTIHGFVMILIALFVFVGSLVLGLNVMSRKNRSAYGQ